MGRKFKSSVLAMLSLKCLLDIQTERPTHFSELHIRFRGQYKEQKTQGHQNYLQLWTAGSGVRNLVLIIPVNKYYKKETLGHIFGPLLLQGIVAVCSNEWKNLPLAGKGFLMNIHYDCTDKGLKTQKWIVINFPNIIGA